jgi:hypothetical protein
MSSSGGSMGGDIGEYNPYASAGLGAAPPLSDPEYMNLGRPFPTAVTVIGVLFLVFGILGIMGGLLGIAQTVFWQFFTFGNADPEVTGMAKTVQKAAPVNIVVSTLNLILSTFMIISAVGLLKKRLWGAKLGTTVAISAIAFKLIESAGTALAQWLIMEEMQNSFRRNSPKVDPAMMSWIMIGGMVFGLLIVGVPLMIFYGWVTYYLKRDATRVHFPTSANQSGSI